MEEKWGKRLGLGAPSHPKMHGTLPLPQHRSLLSTPTKNVNTRRIGESENGRGHRDCGGAVGDNRWAIKFVVKKREEWRGMPRVRLPARFLQSRSSSLSSESCPSCAAAAGTGFSSSSPSSSSASCLNPSPPSSFWTSRRSSSALSREEERFGRLCGISSPIRDVQNDLILGVKQPKQVWLLGQTRSPSAPHGWALQTLSVAYSSERVLHGYQEQRVAYSTERVLHGYQEQQQQEISELVSPSLLKQEEEEEAVVIVELEGLYSKHDCTPAPPTGDNRRSTTFLQGEEEVTTQLYSAVSTSTDGDNESDISELELVDVEEVDRQSEDVDVDEDGQFEAERDRREEDGEDKQRAASRLEHMPQEVAAEREEVAYSELCPDFVNVAPTTAEDAREMGFRESEPDGDQHQDGLPYLHTLSVDEIQEILEKTRAKDVRILQVRKCCEWVDQLVFASGRSSRHLRGMADAIVYKVKQCSANVGPNSFPVVEGRDGERWMAIDCGNIVVHLFLEEARSYYNLEEFWTKKSNPRLVETY